MKIRLTVEKRVVIEESVAAFGEAELVRVGDHIELRGGTMIERAEALEWISMFLPEEAALLRK